MFKIRNFRRALVSAFLALLISLLAVSPIHECGAQIVTNERRNDPSAYDKARGNYYTGRSPYLERLFAGEEPVVEVAPEEPPARFGPSHTRFERDGKEWVRGSMSFPTGMRGHDGLLVEKEVPGEVMVGEPFSFLYRVTNLTDFPIHQVRLMDRVTGAFRPGDADPGADSVSDGVATWNIGDMGPREVRLIRVGGSAAEEGTITTCGWAFYSPILCEPILVLKPGIELVKVHGRDTDGDADFKDETFILCDPIPFNITVNNTGSSALTNVRVIQDLAEGLSSGGQQQLTFDLGSLNPGDVRTIDIHVDAVQTGTFTSSAKVTSDQGVLAEDSVKTMVVAPVLEISCAAPDERFVGRPAEVCYTVTNTGSGPSEETVLEINVPSGASFRGASPGGQQAGDKVVWNIGLLAPGASKEVCATFVGNALGNLAFQGSAQGVCADLVQTTCTIPVLGIPAILLEVVDLDDPIEVGSNETYEIVVTNQGSADGTNIKLVCTLEDSQQFVSVSGATNGAAQGQVVELQVLPRLAPKARAIWRVTVKAVEEGDVRFSVEMTTDQITRPVEETESTNQY